MNTNDKDFDKGFRGEKVDKPVDGMHLHDVPFIPSSELDDAIKKMKEIFNK